MSALRKDETLTTADIVNAENTRETQSGTFDPSNRQPQQGSAVAEPERIQSQTSGVVRDARTLPDLEDTRDPRAQSANSTVVYDTRTDRAAEGTIASGRREENDLRPVTNSPTSSTAEVADAASRATATGPANSRGDVSSGPLFPDAELQGFRSQWDRVQVSFVDEPRQAVQQADSLVANVVKRIAEQFAEERQRLEKQWDRGDDVSTEDLRQGLRRYRALFDRLLSF